ncbi:hypothetical protein ANN_15919 [Periplaneta americana]|uniref:Uncharacterized protein n=1 Tax=Periplaneta americana TaxID=6978 RepID=A0ABQ8SIA0_PERAM|nr:hypothetical protein ANN_15919 [Periplaneta americana]
MAGLCEGGNEPPGSLKAISLHLKNVFLSSSYMPDATPSDYFLWDYVKDSTCAPLLINNLLRYKLSRVWEGLEYHMVVYYVTRGSHIEKL